MRLKLLMRETVPQEAKNMALLQEFKRTVAERV